MTLELTFKQACELIKKDSDQDPKLIEALDNLLGLAVICSPLVLGPTAVALLPTLAVKNEIVKLGKYVFQSISKKHDTDYVRRQERMQMAYGLLVFTAFFDALDTQMPKALRRKLALLEPEKAILAKSAASRATPNLKDLGACEHGDSPLVTVEFAFPHPTESLAQQAERHADLWKQMGQGFSEFVQQLAVWEPADKKEQALMLSWVQKVPEEAAAFFEAQYFELSRRFEDFAIWANLQEHKKSKKLIAELSNYVQHYANLSKIGAKAIDIGFAQLHVAVLDIPKVLESKQASALVESLSRHYQARVNDPIIEDKDDATEGKPRLQFPRVCDAFIPQAFRVLRQTGKNQRLEDEETWEVLPRRSNLGAFLLSYLSSPYSTESPLLILGHPGSGKSLLTTVLSSQLMSEHFTAIRVPLREVNAEVGIVAQIEEAIRRITNISVDSWAKLSGAFKNNPPLVILDGYDELLQASGKVFAGYLRDVQHFQKSEAEQGRAVRVIVTSRVTLIDKATVPFGSTIVRLLEFDKTQRERWIGIWNRTNVNYFREAGIDGFALPDENETGAAKILALAEQPLLLLMLALYDSQGNQLRKSKGLDRTKLYDSLLRRFITRERSKEKGFDDADHGDKKKVLDVEMQRLGVAALGMYNRRKVHILAPELDDDLRFFGLERAVTVTAGRPLSQADLLLGSFFFVHKSKAQHAIGASQAHEEASAFEFLHNTFGEFLTADFILRRALAEVEALQAFQANDALREDLEKRLNSADGFKREWFASLVYTPLFTRPVVLEMMREWVNHVLKEKNLARDSFLTSLNTIVLNQITRLLNKREMPSIIRKETAQEGYRAPFGDHPLLGHIAIYSINLILLRLIVSAEALVVDEDEIDTHEDGARPWDRLTHIWRSWFALDNLNGLTAVMVADRQESKITIQAKERLQVGEGRTRLETCLNVALSLGDNIASGLTGLLAFDPAKDNQLLIDDIARRLESEKIDATMEIAMRRLFLNEQRVVDGYPREFAESVKQALEIAMRLERTHELEHIALSVRRGLRRMTAPSAVHGVVSRDLLVSVFRDGVYPIHAVDVGSENPAAALIFYQTAEEIGDGEWLHEFRGRFEEVGIRRHHPMEFIERNPAAALSWMQLARAVGGKGFMRRMDPRFFERAFHPRYLLEMSERNPEAAFAWIELGREVGGEGFMRRFDPEFLERTFDPRHLLELAEHHPTRALAWLRLVREIGGEGLLTRTDPEFLEHAFHPRQLLKLIERNPEAALAWVQLAREVGGENYLRRIDPEFFIRAFHPRRLLELTERNPEVAWAWIQLARDVAGEEFLRQLDPEFLGHVFHPHYLLELSEHYPDAALAWLQLAREVGGEAFLSRMNPEFFERALHPRHLMELSARNPEAGIRWLQLVVELGEGRMPEEFVDRLLHKFVRDGLLREKPAAFAVALKLARLSSRTSTVASAIAETLTSDLHQSRFGASLIASLPISAMTDIVWLANESGSKELQLLIRELRDSVT